MAFAAIKDTIPVTDTSFEELGLSEPILRALRDAKYDTPTPIQAQAIPMLLDGADLFGIAQTGTGKTAAFTLPLLHNLAEDGVRPSPRAVRALILAPTRELALQISDSIKTYGRHMHFRHAVVMGGVSQRPQVTALRKGLDILVATPGRLLDLIEQKELVLGECEYFILDEADRMFDMGFIRDVRKIARGLPTERQTLLFSATMPAEIQKLAGEILHEPERIEIKARTVAVERVAQQVHHLNGDAKRDKLGELLRNPDLSKVIVFTRTERGADRVVKHLEREKVSAEAIHGNKSQNARQRALDKFKAGKVRVLVATDIASRGIDVDEISHVVNFELPNEAESYVHRIGRTARAGHEGVAISFCDSGERGYLRDIERLIRQQLEVVGAGPAGPETPPPHKKSGGAQNRGRNNGGANKGGYRRTVHEILIPTNGG